MKTCPVKCPPVPCNLHCDYGFMKDKDGCEICKCYEPCEVSVTVDRTGTTNDIRSRITRGLQETLRDIKYT